MPPKFVTAALRGFAVGLAALLSFAGLYEARPRPHQNPTAEVDQLQVAAEGPSTGYSREMFPHWVDADHDGCDTRSEVLIAEELHGRAQVQYPGCVVVAGDWLSLYDGVEVTDPSALDVDHGVSLREGWQSGAVHWTVEQRTAFANELASGDERHTGQLQAVTAHSNRSKGDRDPAEWQPRAEDRCRYDREWVRTKIRWRLTADPAEVAALRRTLAGC
jgi:hypothetical protein